MYDNLFQDHPLGITTIDTGFMRPGLAASHLLVEGDCAAYIDVGTTYSVPRLLAALHAKNIPVENVHYVIVTHVHLDHAGGAGKLMQALPNAQLVVHPRGAPHMIDPTRLIAGATAVYGADVFETMYGDIVPVPAARVIEAPEGKTLNLKDRSLLCVDTPGHAKHHLCVFDEHSQSFFTGDAFGVAYKAFDTDQGAFIFATTTPVQFEPAVMHRSIRRLLSYHPQQMYLTHYGQVTAVTQLADKLHDSIDAQVLLMETFADSGTVRHRLLIDALMDQWLADLKQQGCTLPSETCRELLAMDVKLNVQGLEHWWDK